MRRVETIVWKIAAVSFSAYGCLLAISDPPPVGAILILVGCVCAANNYLCRIAPN